jgi:hypothetical protein
MFQTEQYKGSREQNYELTICQLQTLLEGESRI